MIVAALFVQTDGCYFGLEGVEPWDEKRDARKYAGPWPVVAHPPCQRWGKFWAGQPGTITRTGQRKRKGDDDGCFEVALEAVRKFGGVLEHPEGSHAWAHFGLNSPERETGWVAADFADGWTCCVEQSSYGHYARKPTWLYACRATLPVLACKRSPANLDPAVIARIGLKRAQRRGEVASKGGGTDSRARIGTPLPFRDLLLSIARTCPAPTVSPLPPTVRSIP